MYFTAYTVFLLIGVVSMFLSAFPIPSKVNLFNLAWAFVLLAVLCGGGALVLTR